MYEVIGVHFTFFTFIIGSCVCMFDLGTTLKNNTEHLGYEDLNTTDSSVNQVFKDDSRMEKCPDNIAERTFPDIDYSLLGYNIYKGYPLNDGHDPGFTFPIFTANYTLELKSSDCRYSVPNGMIVIPDVSCSTLYSSTVIQTAFQLNKYMSTTVGVEIGAIMGAFKASKTYRTSISIVYSGENVLIMSSANCRYYFSKLNLHSAPSFSPDFKRWIHRLDNSNEGRTYMDFFEYYGTHFPIDMIFGARYIYQYQMETDKYRKEVQKSITETKSMSVLFFKYSSSKTHSTRTSVTSFLSKVTTRTVTTGAPPPQNGDAMTWASYVKENPVPVKYKLETIDKLFTQRFMGSLNVSYERIADNIKTFSLQYCSFLQAKGLIDTCISETRSLQLESTKLSGNFSLRPNMLLAECQSHCESMADCSAISFCTTCNKNACRIFSQTSPVINSSSDENWFSVIILDNINGILKLDKTAINGIQRGNRTLRAQTEIECFMRCYDDSDCIAFTYCDCPERRRNCQLFANSYINYFQTEEKITSYIISMYIRNAGREFMIRKFENLFKA